MNQVSGFNNQIIAGELVYNQKTFWNLVWTTPPTSLNPDPTPVDLTGATINAQIVRRQISNVQDTRNGLTFDIADYTPTPTPISLTISNRDDVNGKFTLVIDESAWSVVLGDPELDISATDPVAFSGRIKVGFPANGSTPADDAIIFLLFLVRSDGVVNV